MNRPERDPLDSLLAQLPRDVEPPGDLWNGIRAEIESDTGKRGAGSRHWFQLAAAVVLVVASCLITVVVMQRSTDRQLMQARQEVTQQMQPVLDAMPVSFDGRERLGESYDQTRAQLDAEYAKRLQNLPPLVRTRVERDMAEIRRAARDMSATLAQYPSDPLLQDLMMSIYQREMTLLTEVNSMAASSAAGTDL